ncbi:MAG: hypothetical protein AVDCRST_MAG20-365, partial [uncultured Acidimicrobiales bacterium]
DDSPAARRPLRAPATAPGRAVEPVRTVGAGLLPVRRRPRARGGAVGLRADAAALPARAAAARRRGARRGHRHAHRHRRGARRGQRLRGAAEDADHQHEHPVPRRARRRGRRGRGVGGAAWEVDRVLPGRGALRRRRDGRRRHPRLQGEHLERV